MSIDKRKNIRAMQKAVRSRTTYKSKRMTYKMKRTKYELKLDNLWLTKSVYFYSYINKNISDDDRKKFILNLLDEASRNCSDENNKFILDKFRYKDENISNNVKISIRIFLTDRNVYFLRPSSSKPNEAEKLFFNGLKDKIHAYIVLVEYDDYVCVMKKSCADISTCLENTLFLVDLYQLGNLFPDNAEYKKMSFRNMTSSSQDIQSKSFSANDLKGSLALYSAGRSIISGFKAGVKGKIISVANTGRFTENSQRSNLKNMIDWIVENIKEINITQSQINKFLKNFAKKIELSNLKPTVKPNSIMVDYIKLDGLIKKIESDIYYKSENNNFLTISDKAKKKLFRSLERTYSIDDNGEIVKIYATVPSDNKTSANKNSKPVKFRPRNKSKICLNKKSITFSVDFLKKLFIDENGEKVNLNKFIITNKLYSVTFTDFKYMYFMGACFEDTSGASGIDELLNIFNAQSSMVGIKSEKGTFKKNSKNFSKISMFSFVEKKQKSEDDEYIFCDDLLDEWADHITFNDKKARISFIHSKHGKKSTSASNLHDVVGQGIKNLGNMFFSQEQIWSVKFNNGSNGKFFKNYNNNGIQTQISRIRLGSSNPVDIENYLKKLLSKPNLYRQCILSCSFLSKKAIEQEFRKIQNNQEVSGHITQLFWILSSFVYACKEKGVIPIIYCQD